MFMSIGLWAQDSVSTHVIVVWDRYMQVLYLGRALRTKETLPDCLKWRRVTRNPLVFRGLTGSQRTPGFGASQSKLADSDEEDTVDSSAFLQQNEDMCFGFPYTPLK